MDNKEIGMRIRKCFTILSPLSGMGLVFKKRPELSEKARERAVRNIGIIKSLLLCYNKRQVALDNNVDLSTINRIFYKCIKSYAECELRQYGNGRKK
jgi:hypothetical protein